MGDTGIRMHVLFLIHRYPPAVGGSERFTQEIARRLVSDGHLATIYTSNALAAESLWQRGWTTLPGGVEEDRGARVERFRARVLPMHGAVGRLAAMVPWDPIGLTLAPPGLVIPDLWRAARTAHGFDLIHASAFPSLMYLGSVAARRSGARLVLMPCSHPGSENDKAQQRYFFSHRMANLYSRADAVIALTNQERQWLTRVGVAPQRVHVVGAGTDTEAATTADGGRFRARFGLSENDAIVTFIGHKTAGKGALDMLEASRLLLPQRANLVFALIGNPTARFLQSFRALPDQIRKRVLNLRLTEQDKHDLLAASSMLALPSRNDSFGIVLLEAWLHGKPVIGSRAGGIQEVIEEGQTGLLMPHGDVTALVGAISWLLDHPAEASRMGSQGRERVLDNWTWDSVYERVGRAYAFAMDQPHNVS